jgi:hypothetical protein
VTAVLALTAAACGGGGPSEADYVRANARAFKQGFGPAITDDQAQCLSKAVVDAVGVDHLRDGDVDPDTALRDVDLRSDDLDRDGLAEALRDCDYADVFVAGAVRRAGTAVTPDQRECLADELRDDDDFVAASVDDLLGVGDTSRTQQAFADATAGCPDVVAQVFIAGYVSNAGQPLSTAAVTCITDQARADPAAASKLFAGGEEAQAFADRVIAACAGLLPT